MLLVFTLGTSISGLDEGRAIACVVTLPNRLHCHVCRMSFDLTPFIITRIHENKQHSADWCGPCRQFTPELVSFYDKMNARRGKKDKFEIVWVSRCRDFDSFGQYFTHMKWLALPLEEAVGQRGQMLSEKYKVKGIPTLVLLDEVGNTITTDARNKIPNDKAGIGFPWHNPIARVYMTIFPRSLRLMIKSQISSLKDSVVGKIKGGKKTTATA